MGLTRRQPDFAFRLSGSALAGPHPARTGMPLEDAVGQLKEAGVRLVIDLTNLGEVQDAEYIRCLSDEGINHRRFQFGDMLTPTTQEMTAILDAIGRAADRGTVYVHCVSGEGRTGTVAGCYLRQNGEKEWQSALEQLRLDAGYVGRSPDAPEQVRFVEEWRPARDA